MFYFNLIEFIFQIIAVMLRFLKKKIYDKDIGRKTVFNIDYS